MNKKTLMAIAAAVLCLAATAQNKVRPDAFPPVMEAPDSKAVVMATTIDEMDTWDRYPTYSVYLQMMQRWADEFPNLCHIDTIGTSIQGRLILSLYIQPPTIDDMYRPEFFYSSTIHGDEVTGYVMLLRLIDTLLRGYGDNQQYTDIINRTRISINPLSNPDGTYYRGDNTVQGSRRYNAHNVDLNRNYPNPFAPTKEALEPENEAMIAYFDSHNFVVSANLHGGSEVMNYPWDSFTSAQYPHPNADWWQTVCHRFVDTLRTYNPLRFRDVNSDGVVAGGDWYVIYGGRQDYFNYNNHCLELTMEISTVKTLSSDQLPEYWRFLQHSLVNYIEEVHTAPENNGIDHPRVPLGTTLSVSPNPTAGRIVLETPAAQALEICTLDGRIMLTLPSGTKDADLTKLPSGVYLLRCGEAMATVVKR